VRGAFPVARGCGAGELLDAMHKAGLLDAAIIGEVVSSPPGKIILD